MKRRYYFEITESYFFLYEFTQRDIYQETENRVFLNSARLVLSDVPFIKDEDRFSAKSVSKRFVYDRLKDVIMRVFGEMND